jgi:hypothetical protein
LDRPGAGDIERTRRCVAGFNAHDARDVALRIFEAGDGLGTFPFRGRVVPNARGREVTVAYPDIVNAGL